MCSLLATNSQELLAAKQNKTPVQRWRRSTAGCWLGLSPRTGRARGCEGGPDGARGRSVSLPKPTSSRPPRRCPLPGAVPKSLSFLNVQAARPSSRIDFRRTLLPTPELLLSSLEVHEKLARNQAHDTSKKNPRIRANFEIFYYAFDSIFWA